ncbi:MAG: glycerol-3-phosphate dehydrogenase [Methyloversatilis sp.]|uniref:glycerol-3-phosphate dehydrogenase n=1 Tax=Methyloversatilis sp. TaxID=2569862 RepID=UPI0025EDD777|nr:glycerol-3-phosphate dehydrogenase [Methyloversatilis sp.]MCR6668195.1 glycerol-3-phosphate dehydrogenase [Methyloversatilis sp.]
MHRESCDLLIVGAGINGAGIARDAALRGLDVIVCERGDIAGATSSASTKLIHGGLRYLEQGAFGLVRESLQERETLARIAAHLVRPQRFIVPHTGERPAWMLATGLLLYDLLGGRSTLPRSRRLRADFPLLQQMQPPVSAAHAYYDLWVDDARLTLFTLLDAQAHGARVLPQSALSAVTAEGAHWRCTVGDRTVLARCVVNVAGPWMNAVETLRGAVAPPVRLVQGTHIVVPRLHDGDDAWLLQQPDRRIVFVIPFADNFHLVGTTETDLPSPEALGATAAERRYLLDALQRAFGRAPTEHDIRWEFSGMRPLIDGGGGSARTASREYRMTMEGGRGGRGWMSIRGGKLTTHRSLAERAVDRLASFLGSNARSVTADRLLPGAEAAGPTQRSELARTLAQRHPALSSGWIAALVGRHGSETSRLLEQAARAGGPGRDFGGGLYEAEARWCARYEWACNADDVLWRRTKCGVGMSAAQRDTFARWWVDQRIG